MTRNSREDVVRAAAKLFGQRGYHGTSMRDLAAELGLMGSSLYSHVSSKQELLVEVVQTGATLFQASAEKALAEEGTTLDRLRRFVVGHVDVILENVDAARTFLNEARALDAEHRRPIIDARDRYEGALRTLLSDGVTDGSFRSDLDVKLAGIYVLSILNAVDRWYSDDGELTRLELSDSVVGFVVDGVQRST